MRTSSKALISVPAATAVGLGAIIGAGIFVLSGSAIALAGSDALISFMLVGFVAVLVALELGELGSILPKVEGASYSYVYNAFGSELGFITGIIFYFSSATAISAISIGFGSYFANLLGYGPGTSIYFAILLIALLAVLNLMGIKKAVNADFVLVIVKLAALLAFVAFALYFAFGLGHFNPSNFGVNAVQSGIGPIAAASIVIFFAYSGFQTISTLTSKIKGGANAAARSILLSVVLSLVVYVAIIFALILLVPSSAYTVSSADPISLALDASSAPYALELVVGIGALIATASAALAMFLRSSRIVYQLGKDGLLPKALSRYDIKRDISPDAVLATAVVAAIALFSGNVYVIASISVFGVLFTYLMSSFALIHFRRIKKFGSFMSPLYPYLPAVAIISVVAFMYGLPKQSLLIGTIMVIGLILVYYFLNEYEGKKVVKVRLF
ncbi:MAG: APC family permease [Candidatus Micrarchaeaceae archaeon]